MTIKQYIKAKQNFKELKVIFSSWLNSKADSAPERELQLAVKAVMNFHKFGYYKLSRHATEYYKADKHLKKAWRNCNAYWGLDA